ncbi:inner centromere protein [Drosophila innubila]|uniref:inner centromere protein n=1 Tax=Drosophila innubila TaxID=198719 RepID=UPI00148E8316|nr:inner centromere protein [Drosophila innubila]
MHCLFGFIAIVALLTVTSAAGIRPILSISRSDELRRGYQEQDTARAFYSYGYSDENAARAEYTTLDGSSRGFYSYVDANGKLQTVKYEAGGRQGFKAEASNQPKAPVDDKKPPLPVTDTLEVQQAREAHLSALREAQEETRREEAQQQQGKGQDQEQERGTSERTLSDEDADILERVRAELTSMLAEREESRLDEEQNRKENAQEEDDALQQQQRQEEQRSQTANDAKDQRLRTVYTLEDINSSSYLKLSDLQDRLDRNNQELRVPIGAYYSYVSPNAKYSVTTPTELRTLRPVALSRSLLLSKQNQQQNKNKK